jgi:ketosteroid isomerase-like protein
MKTLITLIAAACFIGTAFGQQPNQPPKPSPEHHKLQLWFGEWTYEGESQTTFLGPGGKFTGRMTGRPILDGFGAEYVFVENGPSGETRMIEINCYDPVAKNYPGICISSDGSFFQRTFTMNGNVATCEATFVTGGKQHKIRGTVVFAPDLMSDVEKREISTDGKKWAPLFESKFTKVKAAPAESASVEQELIKLKDGWNDAVVKVDLAFLDRILADDLTDTDPEGTVCTKAQDIADLKSGDFKCTALVTDDYKVRVYGDAAVVTGRNTMKAQFKGKDISGPYRWTDTWIKRDGRWQCVGGHASEVVQK